MPTMSSWLIVLGVIVLTLVYIAYNYFHIKNLPEGTPEMVEMSSIIRSGAQTFLKTEFRSIVIVVLAVALVFSLFVEKTCGLTFIMGAMMSSIVCILGMQSATYANVRTANKARESLSIGDTVKVALCGGSISGLAVQAFGMLGFLMVLMLFGGVKHDVTSSGFLLNLSCNPYVMRVSTYSLGCSIVAMFNRVAGGNYTKAADISSDILGKLRHDLPEDDSRIPNKIADFIGDNVNDIAGNCSDLLESFVATLSASVMIAVTLYETNGESVGDTIFGSTTLFPIVLAGCGLLGCVLGLGFCNIKKMGDNPSKELDLSTWISAGCTVVFGGIASYLLFRSVPANDFALYGFKLGWASPWVSAIMGIVSGVAIGIITEYYTSTDYKPTRELAEICKEGEAFVVTKGDAIGSRSVLLPVLVIVVALIVSGVVGSSYGIAISALGMLGFVGATVSIDAFGPIADNAGGLAEACHLNAKVRVITDKLDAVGNTTAAIGKGFAIGSAAFATVSLIMAYVGNYTAIGMPLSLNFASFFVVAGGILGGALVEYFCAVLTDNTIDSAKKMADVGDQQMTEEVLAGKAKPDYNMMIKMAAQEAIHKMVLPSVLALLIPVIGGFILGVEFVGGILVGATIVAIPRAIFMGNSGGAFDNAKKYIESGQLEGCKKGSPAHRASVTGDTVGDTRKDVVGVSLDIFIKLMSTVANTIAPIISRFSLFR
ncbi:MAG: sodium-translocating pyrophosphatase [Saccharofermentans sp.]|nr:sodium-translocating pyrophosphatase [Mageeibacillus sp.]MCI1274910.1 sodium-translocating pyrophosphatase [Saccharofermentans sp.]MCI1769579.1 sodium-translocating pyrophosphatase [Mageeibacillus sp.]